MRTIYLTLFAFYSTNCFSNDIDKLKTNSDVYNFLVKKVDKRFKKYPPLFDSPKVAERNRFFKLDIDNNGLTDLLIYGFQDFFAVLDNGKIGYKTCYLDK